MKTQVSTWLAAQGWSETSDGGRAALIRLIRVQVGRVGQRDCTADAELFCSTRREDAGAADSSCLPPDRFHASLGMAFCCRFNVTMRDEQGSDDDRQ